jgi:glucokinase
MGRDHSVAVGVEIGGGQTTVALIDSHGHIHRHCTAKTLRGRPATATLEPYLRAIDTMLTSAQADGLQVCGIGVSIPGIVDRTTRRPQIIPILPTLNSFPLCELLETRYNLPAHLHTDVDAAVLGEHRFGAGRGYHRLFFLTVNAVVGAALVIDGKLVYPTQDYTGHVCHLPVATSGSRCSCGKRGCINTLISTDAIQKMVQRALRRGDETSLIRRLLNHEYFSPQLLAEEALGGDEIALQIYNDIARWLGAALAKYIDLFEPNVLILGGSVLHAGDLLLSQVRSILATRSLHASTRICSIVEVVPACLGHEVALVGAIVPLF